MSKENWKPGNMLYPLPAVMVSVGNQESNNIITVAWTGTICSDPPMLYISVRPNRYSYGLLTKYKEFVINITTEALANATDFCGVRSGKSIDKWSACNLTRGKCKVVDCPSIEESPVNIECKIKKILKLGTHDMFMAEVVNVIVDSRYIDERDKFHLYKAKPIAYSHGEYFSLGKSLGSFGYSIKKNKRKKKR